MSEPRGIKTMPDEAFLAALARELAGTPDEDILEGHDAAEVAASGKRILELARSEAGRLRLQHAREAMERRSGPPDKVVATVSARDARQYIAKAANDRQYTLAARNLDEMSDEDVFRLYQQLRALDSSDEE